MATNGTAPLLSRVRFWQLIALGFAGWCALYSVAVLNSGKCRHWVGNTQGGCFAMTMTLAGFAGRRHQRGNGQVPARPEVADVFSTEQINELLSRSMQRQELRVEACHDIDNICGFGLRVVNSGRTMVFETARWQDAVIDLDHVQATDNNRASVMADVAIIVGVGVPDESAQEFAKNRSIRFLLSKELQAMVDTEKREAEKAAAAATTVDVDIAGASAGRNKSAKKKGGLLGWWQRRTA